MTFDPDGVEAVAFDSYGTIVDVTAVEEPLGAYTDDPGAVASLWRHRSLAYAMVATAVGEYDRFEAYLQRALAYALDARGVEVDAADREDLVATYRELPVFEDVHDGLERLVEAGYDCYVVSNGNEEMLEATVDHAGIGEFVEEAISADEVERFKPVPALYEHAADRIGTPIGRIAFAAAGWWDVPGAINAGMQGVWVDRGGGHWGPYETQPDLTVASVRELADELEA